MTAATVARETGQRLQQADADGLNATLAWSQSSLAAEAARVDAMPTPGPLHRIPVAIKDNICTTGLPTTCASRILEGYYSPYNATVVDRLRAAGGMVACKSNLDEFAMGSSTEHSAWGRVRHPLAPERVPGGSSGGSAALVAAGVVSAALGSETGGSVRQPASFCGVVGLKPTYGRVSRYGLVAFGSSLDCVSVFGKCVADAESLFLSIAGQDPLDATTVDLPVPVSLPFRSSLAGVTIGVPAEYFPADLDSGVLAGCRATISRLKELGAKVVEVSLPHTRFAVPTYYIIAPAEAAANLARFDGVRYGVRRGAHPSVRTLYQETRGRGFGPEVRRRILIGTYVLSAGYSEAYYGRAQAARSRIAGDFARVFDGGVDCLFTPTTPTPAFLAGEKTHDPVAMYLADIFVCPASLAGIPAISLPIGRSGGLPVGGQLMAPMFQEASLIGVAKVLERHLDPAAEVAR